jgi:endonuclease/exonuclease/phosphatase family metal-dependent hydrolase
MAGRDSRADGCLKLATWNIHYGIGTDGRFDLDRTLAVLRSIDADVIGLQEVGWHRQGHNRVDVFRFLRENTDYEVVEGLVRDPLRSRFGNAILTRLPVRRTRWIDLKVMGHVPRAAILAEVETAGAPISVVSLHFGLATWERERQAQRLVDALAEDASTENGGPHPPAALLGDFNMLRTKTRAAAILAARFPTAVRKPTYPVRTPMLSLDRIYLSPEWELGETEVIRDGDTLKASDHLPLVASARLSL